MFVVLASIASLLGILRHYSVKFKMSSVFLAFFQLRNAFMECGCVGNQRKRSLKPEKVAVFCPYGPFNTLINAETGYLNADDVEWVASDVHVCMHMCA